MSEPAAPKAPPSRVRRVVRRVVWIGALAVLLTGGIAYWATAHLGHPLVKGRIQAMARDLVGADLDFDHGEVGLAGLLLRGLRIRSAPADDALVGDLLRVASIEVRWDAARLVGGERHVDAVLVHGVEIGVVGGGEGGWSGARALTLPAPATPTEPTRPSSLWAAIEPLRGVDVGAFELGPTTLTASALASPGSRVKAVLPALAGHLDLTAPTLRALLRADGVASLTVSPGDAAMAALAPTIEAVRGQLPGWVVPAPPWSLDALVGLRLEPVAATDGNGVPAIRLTATLDPAATGRPRPERGRWLDAEVEVQPVPADRRTAVALRRLRVVEGLVVAEAALTVRDAETLDALPALALRSASGQLDGGQLDGGRRAWDADVANLRLHLGAGAKASLVVEPMELQPPWRAEARATLALPEASIRTAAPPPPAPGAASAEDAATTAQAEAAARDLEGSLRVALADGDLRLELTSAAAALTAHVVAGTLAIEGGHGQVEVQLPLAMAARAFGTLPMSSAAQLTFGARTARIHALDLPAAATLVDPSLALTVQADLAGGRLQVSTGELEATGPDGAWLQGTALAGTWDLAGVVVATGAQPRLGVRTLGLQFGAETLRGGAGVTAGLRDAALQLTMEDLGLRPGRDGVFDCATVRVTADARDLRAAGHDRAASLHADATVSEVSSPLAEPLATTLRVVSTLRAPGLDATLTLAKADDLAWEARISLPALRGLVQGLGLPWPRALRLAGIEGQSKGKIRRVMTALAALTGATGGDPLATALPLVQIEHEGDVALLGAGWSEGELRVASRRVTVHSHGGGKGLDQAHHVEVRVEGGRTGDAALPLLTATGDARTTAEARRPARLQGAAIEGTGAVDGKERATMRLAVERGASWHVTGAASLKKLGHLASQLLRDLPCPDPTRLSADGHLDVRLHAPGQGEIAPLLAWLATPQRWFIEGKGGATVHGIACHLPGAADARTGAKPGVSFDAAMPEVQGDATFTLRDGKAEIAMQAAIQRLRGAFGAHPFDLRRASANATFRAPISTNLRGSALAATFAIGELRQDLLPTWRVADTKGELRVAVDARGRIELERLRVHNPAGGSAARIDGIIDRIGDTSVLGLGDASGVPGSRGVAIQGELSQDLGALGEMFGVRMGGKVTMPFELESGDLTVFGVRARARLDAVELRHDGLRVQASEISGEVPFAIELVVDGQGIRPLGGGRRSAWSRWRFADHHPFMSGDHFVSIGKLRWRDDSFGPLAGNARFDHDVFRLDQLELRVLGGQVTGSCVVELDGAATKVLLRGNATDIRLPGHPGRLDANAALEIEPWKLAISGRAQLLRITTAHLRAMLDAFDPYREDVQANRARMALNLGRPEQVRLRFRHGFVDLWLQLGGLAEVVSIDEIRGVPLGPLMTQWLEPLLGDPPP